jgi:hypothetical protein
VTQPLPPRFDSRKPFRILLGSFSPVCSVASHMTGRALKVQVTHLGVHAFRRSVGSKDYLHLLTSITYLIALVAGPDCVFLAC